MFAAVKKYAVFSGRARRQEFWLFVLLYSILSIISIIAGFWYVGSQVVDMAASNATVSMTEDQMAGAMAGLVAAYGLALIIWVAPQILLFLPYLGVSIRRLHDTDRSGWWFLIVLVPLIGPIWFLVLTFLDGTIGDNRFGPDPKGRAGPSPTD